MSALPVFPYLRLLSLAESTKLNSMFPRWRVDGSDFYLISTFSLDLSANIRRQEEKLRGNVTQKLRKARKSENLAGAEKLIEV